MDTPSRNLLHGLFLPTVQSQEGLSFGKEPFSLGWASVLWEEPRRQRPAMGDLICSRMGQRGAFWETMRTYCWIPALRSSFGSNCPVQSIRRGQRRYPCEVEKNEFLIYRWQLNQIGLIFFIPPPPLFLLEGFKMNYKSEELPKLPSLIKHITCIKPLFSPAAERLCSFGSCTVCGKHCVPSWILQLSQKTACESFP